MWTVCRKSSPACPHPAHCDPGLYAVGCAVHLLWLRFGIHGKKERGSDWPLRPCLELADYADAVQSNPVTSVYAALGKLKAQLPVLSEGKPKELLLTTQHYAFARVLDGEAVVAVLSNSDQEARLEFGLPVEAAGAQDLLADAAAHSQWSWR